MGRRARSTPEFQRRRSVATSRILWLGLSFILAFLSVSSAAGLVQETQKETIRVETVLVTVTATVFDRSGRYVSSLRREDFSIFEDGVRQEIASFTSDEDIPVSIGILFDTSGSMVDKIEAVQDAVKHFVDKVKPADEIYLLRFNNRVDIVIDFTDQRERLHGAVDRLRARGGTALYDAISEGLEKVSEGKHKKKALLLITDGNDTTSSTGYLEALDLATKSEVLIYCLGIGHGERGSFGHLLGGHKDTVDIEVLRAFSDATGGRSYLLEGEHHSHGVDRIDEAVVEVASELRQQYSLGYYPSNTDRSAGYRKIRVQVANPTCNVRARNGYWWRPGMAKAATDKP